MTKHLHHDKHSQVWAPEERTLVARKIAYQGDDRILIWGRLPDYYVIAPPGIEIRIGDKIKYEPCGVNFGWYAKVDGDNNDTDA